MALHESLRLSYYRRFPREVMCCVLRVACCACWVFCLDALESLHDIIVDGAVYLTSEAPGSDLVDG